MPKVEYYTASKACFLQAVSMLAMDEATDFEVRHRKRGVTDIHRIIVQKESRSEALAFLRWLGSVSSSYAWSYLNRRPLL
jgi:hypothetical protein